MALSDALRKRVVEAAFWAAVAQCVDSVLLGYRSKPASAQLGSRKPQRVE